MSEVELELAEASVWDDPDYAQRLGRERSALEMVVSTIKGLEAGLADVGDIIGLAAEENDDLSLNLKENENSNVVKFASLNDQIQIQSDDYDEYGERLVKASS